MSGMQLYVKFMFTLGIGLVGLGIVMTTTFETLFREWDAPRDFSRWLRALTHGRPHVADVSADEILLALERARVNEGRYQRRAPSRSIDRRREALREISEVEGRLSAPELI
ncbi:MAG: hypothetical protein SF051_00020 [Elusimicrobiota bacterium]|nr:hypothetical protein [Elusimicrobiota bacterium]